MTLLWVSYRVWKQGICLNPKVEGNGFLLISSQTKRRPKFFVLLHLLFKKWTFIEHLLDARHCSISIYVNSFNRWHLRRQLLLFLFPWSEVTGAKRDSLVAQCLRARNWGTWIRKTGSSTSQSTLLTSVL